MEQEEEENICDDVIRRSRSALAAVDPMAGYLRGMHINWRVPLQGGYNLGCNIRGVNLQGALSPRTRAAGHPPRRQIVRG